MRWLRRRREPESAPSDLDDTVTEDVNAKLEDAGRQLAESRSRAARAHRIAEESDRLVERNSIAALIRDSIITPHARG